MCNNIIMILVLYQKNMFMHCNPASKPNPIQWNPSLQTPLKQGHPLYSGHWLGSQLINVCIKQPLK